MLSSVLNQFVPLSDPELCRVHYGKLRVAMMKPDVACRDQTCDVSRCPVQDQLPVSAQAST